MNKPKAVVSTDQAPNAIGPYSQAIAASWRHSLLFCSGQIALDPQSGELVGEGDVAAQTRQVMDNLGAVLEAGGASFDSVVKTTIFLADMGDFAVVNEIYDVFPSAGKILLQCEGSEIYFRRVELLPLNTRSDSTKKS